MKPLRVMTFNVRFDNPKDIDKGWLTRKEIVASIIKRYHPHIVGIQEPTWRQIEDLRMLLPEYDFCLKGRVWDDTCQYPTLLFQKEEVTCSKNGEFWLSLTPHIHRSCDWNSAFPRMLSYGIFNVKDIEQPIVVAVTHLDHKSATAREYQISTILKWYRGKYLQTPFILLGDFNEPPYQKVHIMLSQENLKDTWQALGFQEDENAATHHDFEGKPVGGRIDWIFISEHFGVLNGCIVKESVNGRYPSDHFPYYVDLFLRG